MHNYYKGDRKLRWCVMGMLLYLIPGLTLAQEKVYAHAQQLGQHAKETSYKPLLEVLNEIKEHYSVSFLYEPVTLEDRKVKTPVNYRGKVENTLSKILEPEGLTFKRINSKTYSILPQSTTKRAKNEPGAALGAMIAEPSSIKEADEIITYSPPVDIVVSGVLTDETDNPLPGVNVLVKGTTIGTTSDGQGRYSLSVPDENAVLIVSFIGYMTQEIPVGTQTTINIKLQPDVQQLGEVVVVGYGTQKKTSVTGAISSVSSKELSAQPVVNVGQALQGRVAGVTVVNNGAPGAAPIVRIRGVGTVNNANPLYVIDGFPTGDLNSINPKDIESLEVLKDASAAAIYGSRAANGVILITTKKGSNKKLSVNLESSYGFEEPWRKLDLLNTEQYIDYATDLMTNADIYKQETKAPTDPDVVIGSSIPERIRSGGLDQPINSETSQTFRQTNTDWQNEMFRTAPIQQHKAELMGGTEKSRMFASVGYFDQEGIMKGTGYKRGDARFNSDHNISERITFGQNFYVAYDERLVEQNAGGRTQLQHIIRSSPYFPVRNPDNYGGFFGAQSVDGSDPENPVRVAEMDQQNQQRLKFLGNGYVDVKLFDFLTYRFQGGVDYVDYTQRTHTPAYSTGNGGYSNRSAAGVNINQQNFVSTILTNQLTFNKNFGKHNVNATAVAEQQTFTFSQTTGLGNNTQSNDIQEPVALANQAFNGNKDESALISYVARVNYDYADKYFIGASIRRDGSSRFIADKRWGTFPAVSAGWRLSEESFLQGVDLISELKLRASYGLAGNFLTPGVYDYISTISGNQIYEFNRGSTTSSAGYTIRALANPEIKWETSRMTNIGIDVGFLANKFTLTAEYFNTRTTDMILPRPVPLSYGYDTPPTANVGEVENKGFELQLGFNKIEGDFNFNISGNLSVVRNEIISLGDEGTTISSGDWYGDNLTQTKVGQPIGFFNGYVTDGLFQEGESSPLQPEARPGDIRFKDVNGDGALNNSDKQNIGHFLPDFSYGINFSGTWKGFDATLFLQGVSGNEIYSVVKYELEGMSRLFNSGTAVLNRWTPENTNTDVPRAVSGDPNRNGRASDRFIEDGSYFRVKNLTIGYTVPSSIFSAITNSTLTKLRIYMTSQNLLTLTNYESGYDPEIGNRNDISVSNDPKAPLTTTLTQGIDYGQFPQSRSIVFGVQIGF